MSILTAKMQSDMYAIQCAAGVRDRSVRLYVAKSFAAVPYLIEEGHLASRKEVEAFIGMVKAATEAYLGQAKKK